MSFCRKASQNAIQLTQLQVTQAKVCLQCVYLHANSYNPHKLVRSCYMPGSKSCWHAVIKIQLILSCYSMTDTKDMPAVSYYVISVFVVSLNMLLLANDFYRVCLCLYVVLILIPYYHTNLLPLVYER